MYKVDKNGNEIYDKKKTFVTNSRNDEIYAKDVEGNETYPGCILAKDRYNNYYYAKDKHGNEHYPKRKKSDVMFTGNDGRVLIARLHSLKERYPRDKSGREHYPVDESMKPFYLVTESGMFYSATKKNKPVSFTDEKNYVYKKRDVLGNKIYTTDPKVGRKMKNFDINLFSVICLSNLPLLVSMIVAASI